MSNPITNLSPEDKNKIQNVFQILKTSYQDTQSDQYCQEIINVNRLLSLCCNTNQRYCLVKVNNLKPSVEHIYSVIKFTLGKKNMLGLSKKPETEFLKRVHPLSLFRSTFTDYIKKEQICGFLLIDILYFKEQISGNVGDNDFTQWSDKPPNGFLRAIVPTDGQNDYQYPITGGGMDSFETQEYQTVLYKSQLFEMNQEGEILIVSNHTHGPLTPCDSLIDQLFRGPIWP